MRRVEVPEVVQANAAQADGRESWAQDHDAQYQQVEVGPHGLDVDMLLLGARDRRAPASENPSDAVLRMSTNRFGSSDKSR
jgi:hypothetical protein